MTPEQTRHHDDAMGGTPDQLVDDALGLPLSQRTAFRRLRSLQLALVDRRKDLETAKYRRDREILEALDCLHMPIGEVARALNVTETRVRQILAEVSA